MEYCAIPVGFHLGLALDAYRYLGAHPCKEGGYVIRVWAPGALQVQVCGDWNSWKGEALEKESSGVWNGYFPNAGKGQLYKFRILGADGIWTMRSDPYAFSSEKRPGTASVLVNFSEFPFADEDWRKSQDKNYNKPMNIYELHVGSWKHAHRLKFSQETTENHSGIPGEQADKLHQAAVQNAAAEGAAIKEEEDWYTYDELAKELIPWLKAHSYTHVELLPVSEHPFDGSWGYQTTGYFSVTSRYGTPAQFASLVNQLHQAGIGVIVDFVPVHFSQNMDALARFDGTALYEYDSDVGHSEWGTCNFNFYRGEVCSFLSSAAALWLDVYHCDGIRMDAISRAIYWQGNDGRGVNEGGVRFLRKMNQGLHKKFPAAMLMAEDSTNYLKVTAPVEYEGLGFDYKWDMGWMHDTLDYFATPFGERRDHYHKLTFSISYFYNELFLLALSHDEVVHGKKTIIDKLWGTYEEKCAQARTLYFYMYTHPGKKLNFMGNELAHFREWDEKKEMDWFLLTYPFHDAFQSYIAELGRLYTTLPALYDGEYDSHCFEWVACESRDEGIYAWLRRSQGQTLLCVMNTQDHAYSAFPLYMKQAWKATELLGSEWDTWGGKGRHLEPLVTTEGGVYGRDYTLKVALPAMGSCLFELK